MDGEATTAEIGFVELGIVHVTGEAGEFPDDDALLLAGWLTEMGDHGKELFTTDCGGSGTGDVFEDVGEDVVVIGAPLGDDGLLLRDGQVLIVTTGVTKVGGKTGLGREGGGHGY